jgi:hypothetical protein
LGIERRLLRWRTLVVRDAVKVVGLVGLSIPWLYRMSASCTGLSRVGESFVEVGNAPGIVGACLGVVDLFTRASSTPVVVEEGEVGERIPAI